MIPKIDGVQSSNLYTSIDAIIKTFNSPSTLSEFVKPALITAPLFIEDTIVNDDIYQGILKNLLNLYASFVMVAIELDQVIEGTTTLKDIIGKVSTENFMNYIDIDKIEDLFTKNQISLEASDNLTKSVGIKSMFATGRLLKIELKASSDNKKNISFKLYTQFINRIVTKKFIKNLFDLLYRDKKYRFTKYLAGEISFWKDFVFGLDRLKKIKETLKDVSPDDIDTISTLINKSNTNKLSRYISLIFQQRTSSVNVYNNIYILSDKVFKEICTKNGLNYKRKKDIDKLMNNIKSIFLVVVDQMNHIVDIYISGLSFPSSYTYKEIMHSSSEKSDLFEMMNIFEMLRHGSNNAL